MAKRKAKTRRRRRMSESYLSSGRKRRRSTRRRRGLSEMFTQSSAMDGGRNVIGGALGGVTSAFLDIIAGEDVNPLTRAALQMGGSFVLSAGFGMKGMGAGMAGAYIHGEFLKLHTRYLQENGDTEDAEYTDPDALSQNPDAVDAEGNPMYLAEDGQFYYLEEMQQMDESYLSANSQAQLYPGYVNTSNF